jgi:agmatinase
VSDHRFYGPRNFLGLEPEQSDYGTSRVVVLPVPYDSTTSARAGAREGPGAIISASQDIELYDVGLGFEPYLAGIHTLPDVAPDTGNPERMMERIRSVVAELLDDGKIVAMLGGEHTVSVGAVRATAERVRGLSVLVIDAHADMRDEYLGTRYNHACSIRRHMEAAPVVQVGLRSASAEEAKHIRDEHLPFYSPESFRTLDDGVDAIVSQLSDDVYINIDIDGYDPSQVAGVGTPEPGGLFWHELDPLFRAVAARKRIVGFDVTELAPVYGVPADAHLAAKLTYRLMGLALGPLE